MQNELHDRLEYLVNYSSQLIFVSGDSIANQQRTLETFVYQQHDDTEIAYLTADATMDIADYRRQFCRQLLGQVVGSFVRPLNELLSELNRHEGPVLIAITQAQHIPDTLLQELWDLVLQSRFAGNKQHLNVLLFGETAWAERAKQWLPSKNTDTPLLISSQSVHAQRDESDLDKLIARRRQEFQAHLASRSSQSSASPINLLASRWFIGSAVLVFIALFFGLVAWQYGSDIKMLFSPLQPSPQSESTQAAPGDNFAELLGEEEQPVTASQNTDDPADRAIDTPAEKPTDDLVAAWPDAVTALDQPASATQQDEITEAPPSGTAKTAETDGSVTLTTTDQAQNTAANNSQQQATADTQSEASAAPPSQTQEVSPAQASDDNTQPSLITDVAILLETIRPTDYYIQMAGLSDRTLLSQFINDNKLRELTHVYRTYRYGGNWYVVLFHQPFADAQQAKSAMQQLPDYQGRKDAFVKKGEQIRGELTTAETAAD